MLYAMLYASGEGYKRERGWIVRLLKEAVRSEAVSRTSLRRQIENGPVLMFLYVDCIGLEGGP